MGLCRLAASSKCFSAPKLNHPRRPLISQCLRVYATTVDDLMVAGPIDYGVPSAAPLMVEHMSDSTLYFMIGGTRGSRIITAVAQGVLNVLDRQMNGAEAVKEPRFGDQLIPT